ncbi:CIA30 family protein [Maribacter sp. 2210JD10-5]|uniref:CIA30 family protein n=1 Tax=Maribacter sp. 2210JD10-5 TaxID=3386272 RepID=UPI0039BD019E
MKRIITLVLILITSTMASQTIIDLKKTPTTKGWKVVDDVVMGGRSSGTFEISEEGYGKFYGEVSLENNGGFSSVRYDVEPLKVGPKSKIQVRLKGDGKTYQFRVKANKQDYYSYITIFKTTGDWQNLEFVLADLHPTFRGRKLDLPNFDQNTIEELRFLIGNKKAQQFELLLESIKIIP